MVVQCVVKILLIKEYFVEGFPILNTVISIWKTWNDLDDQKNLMKTTQAILSMDVYSKASKNCLRR